MVVCEMTGAQADINTNKHMTGTTLLIIPDYLSKRVCSPFPDGGISRFSLMKATFSE
jgi:hypothetical protein